MKCKRCAFRQCRDGRTSGWIEFSFDSGPDDDHPHIPMKADFWHQRWNNKEIQFHEHTANPLLVRHLHSLALPPGSRVFVPMCGKTLDIGWLLARGHRVVAAELSEDAVEQLFAELGIEARKTAAGRLIHYQAEHIDMFVGDVFDVSRDTLGPVDAVYDRAALVALPEEMRRRYARHINEIANTAPQLLISYEYDQSLLDGPPFAVSEDEIAGHYGRTHELTLLERESMSGGLKGKCPAAQSVWLLRPKPKAGDEQKSSPPETRWQVAGLSLTMLLASLGTSVANVALPTLAQEFGASLQEVQWIVIAYLLAITVLIVGAGRLGDWFGRQRLLMVGVAVFAAASFLSGLAPSLGFLIATRVVQGLGAAVMMSLALATISEVVPKGKTGSAMGLLGAMSAAGTAFGPALGGLLLSLVGWRAIFTINAPLGLLALVLLRQRQTPAREAREPSRNPFDLLGMMLLGISLTAYATAMTLGRGHLGWMNVALLAVAGIGTTLFVAVESRSPSPLMPLALLHDRERRTGLVLSLLVATVLMTSLVVGPFYLTYALGLSASQVGLIMSAGPLVVVLAGVPAGRLVDRHGASSMTFLGLTAIGASTMTLALLPVSVGVPGYAFPLMVMTAGYALFQTANNTAMMSKVSSDQRGLVSGLLNLSRNLGLITGSSVITTVFATASGGQDLAITPPEAVVRGMHVAFAAATAVTLAAIVFALSHRRPQQLPEDLQPCCS